MRATITILVVLLAPGCLAKQLRGPAQDHYVQSITIADSCKDEGWGQGVCTQEMVDEMAKQAKCIHLITVGEPCNTAPEEPKP